MINIILNLNLPITRSNTIRKPENQLTFGLFLVLYCIFVSQLKLIKTEREKKIKIYKTKNKHETVITEFIATQNIIIKISPVGD